MFKSTTRTTKHVAPKSRGKKLVTMTTVGLVGVGAAAFAYWTTTGSGTGTAQTGGDLPIVVNQISTPTGLAPGGTPQALAGDFDNPNAGGVSIDEVTAVVADVTEADGETGICDPDDFTIAGTSVVSDPIPAGDGQGSWSGLTIALQDTGVNQNPCKNATVQIEYTAG